MVQNAEGLIAFIGLVTLFVCVSTDDGVVLSKSRQPSIDYSEAHIQRYLIRKTRNPPYIEINENDKKTLRTQIRVARSIIEKAVMKKAQKLKNSKKLSEKDVPNVSPKVFLYAIDEVNRRIEKKQPRSTNDFKPVRGGSYRQLPKVRDPDISAYREIVKKTQRLKSDNSNRYESAAGLPKPPRQRMLHPGNKNPIIGSIRPKSMTYKFRRPPPKVRDPDISAYREMVKKVQLWENDNNKNNYIYRSFRPSNLEAKPLWPNGYYYDNNYDEGYNDDYYDRDPLSYGNDYYDQNYMYHDYVNSKYRLSDYSRIKSKFFPDKKRKRRSKHNARDDTKFRGDRSEHSSFTGTLEGVPIGRYHIGHVTDSGHSVSSGSAEMIEWSDTSISSSVSGSDSHSGSGTHSHHSDSSSSEIESHTLDDITDSYSSSFSESFATHSLSDLTDSYTRTDSHSHTHSDSDSHTESHTSHSESASGSHSDSHQSQARRRLITRTKRSESPRPPHASSTWFSLEKHQSNRKKRRNAKQNKTNERYFSGHNSPKRHINFNRFRFATGMKRRRVRRQQATTANQNSTLTRPIWKKQKFTPDDKTVKEFSTEDDDQMHKLIKDRPVKNAFKSEIVLQIALLMFSRFLRHWNHRLALANWNHITDMTNQNARKLSQLGSEFEKALSEWEPMILGFYSNVDSVKDADKKRQLTLAAGNFVPRGNASFSEIVDFMEETYAKGKVCNITGCYDLEPTLIQVMQTSRSYDSLYWAWNGWRQNVGVPIREYYTQYVEQKNNLAKNLGANDFGEVWRDSTLRGINAADLEQMCESLYEEISSFYKELHAYVRARLYKHYKSETQPGKPIEPHLLGNMWAQSWGPILDLVTPYPEAAINLTRQMKRKDFSVRDLVKMADRFYKSLGMPKMTKEFWKNSVFERKPDAKMQCHASAEDLVNGVDYRIKMCGSVSSEYLHTIHHEMGHIQYFMAYAKQPLFYQDAANGAFHEAVGDTISLSAMTPEHLERVGLLTRDFYVNHRKTTIEETEKMKERRHINFLMEQALNKVPFLGYSLSLDKWRWDVFRGQILPGEMNEKYWDYRNKYQGLATKDERNETFLDPAAKYHVAADLAYIRYFFSYILQFMFHEALCKESGHQGRISQCDIYNSRKAGNKLWQMMSYGKSKPWQTILKEMTGYETISIQPMLDYFKPLHDWLIETNQKEKTKIGWES